MSTLTDVVRRLSADSLSARTMEPKSEKNIEAGDGPCGPYPVDVIPLLLERIEQDRNIKVRRQAVAMLAYHRTPDPRVVPIFKKIVAEEADNKLRRHAKQGLKRYGIAGVSV